MSALHQAIEHSVLGWVKPELDETLRQVGVEIEGFADDPADTGRMRVCADLLHQVQGTLRMVELYAPAMVAEEMENLSSALREGAIADRDAACSALMRGAVLLPDYLERLQSGHKEISIVLLPMLNELRAARGESGLSESVLFNPDLDRALPASLPRAEMAPATNRAQEAAPFLLRLRDAMQGWPEQGLPADAQGLQFAADALLARTADEPQRRMFWVAAMVAEAVRDQGIAVTAGLRQAFASVEREARSIFAPSGYDAPRADAALEPTRQMLFHVANSDSAHASLAKLREVFDLDALKPTESELDHARGSVAGRNRSLLDTVAGAVKEDLLRVKDELDLYLRTGKRDPLALQPQAEALQRVSDTLGMLGLGLARSLVQQQRDAVQEIVDGKRNADEGVLLEVAGALLYVDASLDDQVARLASGDGADTEEDLANAEARKVLDVLVREAITNFAAARQAFVAFVETSWSHAELEQVPKLLNDVSGALNILELPLPAQYLDGVRLYTEIELLDRHRIPNSRQLDTFADALASVEYYLEALREQRANRDDILDITRNSLETLGYWPLPAEPARTAAAPPVATPAPVERPAPAAVDTTPAPVREDVAIELSVAPPADMPVVPPAAPPPRPLLWASQFASPPATSTASTETPDAPVAEPLAEPVAEPAAPSDPVSEAAPVELVAPDASAIEAVSLEEDAFESVSFDAVELEAIELGAIELEAIELEAADAEAASIETVETDAVEATAPVAVVEAPVVAAAPIAAGFDTTSDDIDDEIREIFLEEFEEEIGNLGQLLPAWKSDPNSIERLQPVRRVFHTLKGSGRLVGAKTLGEFSWKIENMLNKVRDGLRPATPPVISMVDHACAALPQLHAALAGDGYVNVNLAAMEALADRIAAGEEVMPSAAAFALVAAPAAVAVDVAETTTVADSPVDTAVADATPADDGIPVRVDAVLFEILQAEVGGHLGTIERWLERARALPTSADEPLVRAIHTMNGAFAMTEVPGITDALTPAESYVRRLLASGGLADAEAVDAIGELAGCVRSTIDALSQAGGRVPRCDRLAARFASLRDALPESRPATVIDEPVPLEPASVHGSEGIELTELDLSAYGQFDAQPTAADSPAAAPAAETPSMSFPGLTLDASAEEELARLLGEMNNPSTSAPSVPVASEPPATTADVDDTARLLAMMESFEAERAEAERAGGADTEVERLEAERLEAERLEAERLEAERLEAERLEAERLEAERLEGERLEAERLEAERLEAERLEFERLEAERLEAERLEAERLEAERLEAERLEAERLEAERLEAERLEAERLEAERLEAERLEAERLEAERLEAERLEAERLEAERLEAERLEAERLEAERLEAELLDAERRLAEAAGADDVVETPYVPEEAALIEDAAAEPEPASDMPAVEASGIEVPAIAVGGTAAAAAVAAMLGKAASVDPDEALDMDDLDEDLVDIFVEEGRDLLDHSDQLLVRLRESPDEREVIGGLQRDLHTLKGGARMAGIMPIGELGHAMESLLEAAAEHRTQLVRKDIPLLERGFDRLHTMVTRVGDRRAISMPDALIEAFDARAKGREVTLPLDVPAAPVLEEMTFAPVQTPVQDDVADSVDARDAAAPMKPEPTTERTTESATGSMGEVDAAADDEPSPIIESAELPAAPTAPRVQGLRPLSSPLEAAAASDDDALRGTQEQVRVRAELLDRLVNYAGEVAIYRSRLEQQLGAFRSATAEMEQTNIRLRDQLRRLEIETEAQIIARYQRAGEEVESSFDPLELDRFSNLQQLSRALVETSADLGSLHTTLDDLTQQYETLLLQQSRVSSELQEGLMRTRMVPFDTVVPRLRRVLRQAASDTGKQVQLRLDGAQGELDRNVLERMTAPLEHMLRNSVAHGLEMPDVRTSAGKAGEGVVQIAVRKEGSEVVLQVSDDGRGLDRDAIRARGEARGLVRKDVPLSNAQLDTLIFEPGFSTAEEVTRLAGRGVGMDVVASEVRQLGGTIDIHSEPGKGTVFTLRLPQTLAVTQAAFVLIGETTFAVPIASVRGVGRIPREELAKGVTNYRYGNEEYVLHDLGKLLGHAPAKAEGQLQMPLLLTRSGDLHIAVTVDQIIGNREIVVKPIGPQVASIPGIFGATIMGDGSVVVILDVAPLVRRQAALAAEEVIEVVPVEERPVPLVMVVDDSITMRKVTGRVLERNNFEVITAKDGLDALERMVERVPDLMLLDIEMPRMDGYELATAMKADARLAKVPIIMITSRTGDKHRQRAMDIGVDRYLGKPYQENELMRNVFSLLELESVRPNG
jgi:chemosensory pili system protein ChpA (sensor histidine kinase/response regulator)